MDFKSNDVSVNSDNNNTSNNDGFIRRMLQASQGRPKTQSILAMALTIVTLPLAILSSLTKWKSEISSSSRGYWSYQEEDPLASDSFMKAKFHPSPDFFYLSKVKNEVAWLARKVGFAHAVPDKIETSAEASQLLDLLAALRALVGVVSVKGFVKTTDKNLKAPSHRARGEKAQSRRTAYAKTLKRKTCRAEFVLSGGSVNNTMSETPFKFIGDYKRALKFVAEFEGRVHTWYSAWITAKALRLAKVGLVDIVLTNYLDELVQLPLTSVFVALAVAEFGARKEFTLESQKQGVLNEHLKTLLQVVIDKEPEGLRFVAYIFPTQEIFAKIPPETVEEIHNTWKSWARPFAEFMESEWMKGVQKSSRRQMRVLPGPGRYGARAGQKGSGVNSAGWNSVADAWQNMGRFMRLTGVLRKQSSPLHLKVLQLIANDQFGWASAAEKKMDPNVAVFRDLTAAGILPWRVALGSAEFDSARAVTVLASSCAEHKCSLESWLGLPKVREGEVRQRFDMICGVAVPPMSGEAAEFLKTLGIFGAKEWGGK